MTVSDLTLRDWSRMNEMPGLRGLLSSEHATWLAGWGNLTLFEAQECARRVAAARYLCMTGQCDHEDADRPAGRNRLPRRRLAA